MILGLSLSLSILKVSVSEGVVSSWMVANGQVSVSDDEVLVSDDEAETPSLVSTLNIDSSQNENLILVVSRITISVT